MPIPTYTPGYPPDGSSLGQTKATIRNNLDGTFETVGVDHINNNGQPGSKPAGYHNVVHMVPQGSDPGAVTGYGQLYSKTINDVTSDQALFWETGAGLIAQLTTNLTPVAAVSGYTFLPGGLILQWGTVSSTTSGDVTFATNNIEFPSNCFVIWTQPFYSTPTPNGSATVGLRTITNASFHWNFISNSGSWNGFFWIALGN